MLSPASISSSAGVAVFIIVFAWLLIRQLSPRPQHTFPWAGLILAAVGALETSAFLAKNSLTASDIGLLVLSGAIGSGLAILRAFTVRLWRNDRGVLYRQGTWLTAVLWLVSMAQHFAIESLTSPGVGVITILLYFGLVLVVQNLMLNARARARGLGSPSTRSTSNKIGGTRK